IDVGLGERREDGRDRARLVGEAEEADPRLVLVVGDARDELAFHVHSFEFLIAYDHRTGAILERGEDAERHFLTHGQRSEEHTSELPSLMRTSYAVFFLK